MEFSAGEGERQVGGSELLRGIVLQVEGIFNSDASYSWHGKNGMADGEGHPLDEFYAKVSRVDGGTGHFFEVQANAVADSRDVIVTETRVDKDLLSCGVDIPVAGPWPNGGDGCGLGPFVDIVDFLLLFRRGGL